MQWKNSNALWLVFVMTVSGCAGSGVVVKPPTELPKMDPPDPELMVTPTYGPKVRVELFDSPTTPTSK